MNEQVTCLREEHDLFHARCSMQSHDGTRVYVLCFCGQARVVLSRDWQKIEAERARLARTHTAVEREET